MVQGSLNLPKPWVIRKLVVARPVRTEAATDGLVAWLPLRLISAGHLIKRRSVGGCGQSMREERQVPTLLRGGWPTGCAPNIQDTSGGVLIRVSFRERDSAIGHDWAIPVTAAAGEIGDLRSAGGIINVQTAAGIVNVEQAAGDDGTGSTRGVVPHGSKRAIAVRPGSGSAIVGGEQPGLLLITPDRKGGEEHALGRSGDVLQFAGGVWNDAGDGGNRDQTDETVLTALRQNAWGNEHGRSRT